MPLRFSIICPNFEVFLINEFVSVYLITIGVWRYIINFPNRGGEEKIHQGKMPTGKIFPRNNTFWKQYRVKQITLVYFVFQIKCHLRKTK